VGASPFLTVGMGERPSEVFMQLRHEALAEHGRCGNTGTLAEKEGFEVIHRHRTFGERLEENHRWGPAFCLKVRNEHDCSWFPGHSAVMMRDALAQAKAEGKRLYAFFGYACD